MQMDRLRSKGKQRMSKKDKAGYRAAWIALACGNAGAFQISAVAEEAKRPNIIFVMVDDLGWMDTSVYGSTYYQTPNIDRLAGQGMRFTEAYSASPLCSPTRASIMTGMSPARSGFTAAAGHVNEVLLEPVIAENSSPLFKAVTPKSVSRLDPSYYTLAEALKDAGYRTAHFGKWHMGGGSYAAKHQGFEETIDGGKYPGPVSYFSPYQMENVPDGPEGEHIDRMITERAVEFIRQHKEEPFYINLWLYSVHTPIEAEEQLVEKYERLRDPDNPQNNPVMAAMIETMDDCIGNLMQALETMGLDQNTLVIFFSDNGGLNEPWGELGQLTSNAPLREGKGWSYEGGSRVPLIVRWPGQVEAGVVSDALVSSVDFYPTFLELTGATMSKAPPKQVLDGISLLPVLQGKMESSERDIFCFFPHTLTARPSRKHLKEAAAYVRRGDHKLIRFFARGENGQDDLELYYLGDDIGEKNNLADAMPEKAAQLNSLLDNFLSETDAVIPIPNPSYDPHIQYVRVQSKYLNSHITYSQRGDRFVQIFNPVSFYHTDATLTLQLTRPLSGKVFWSIEDDVSKIKDRAQDFSTEDFDQDGKVVVNIGGGDIRIKDIRVEVYGAEPEEKPFKELVIVRGKNTEVLRMDF
jgi:arylsulfatase A-like enzyme